MTQNTNHSPGYRLSIPRLIIVVVSLALLAGLAFWWVQGIFASSDSEASETWLAPYVDVTLTPTFHFEDPSLQPANDVALGFVVADSANVCEPSWGGYYDLEAAARALDLDRRIVRLRERGGDVIVSFGGLLNDELAVACDDVDRLTGAYQAVIDRYDAKVLDFDVEGAAIADSEANARRAEAIRRLQRDNEDLQVWFTLPVAPRGLLDDSVELLETTVGEGVDLAGVNVMTMNYSASREDGVSMHEANVAALNATFEQLEGVLARAGDPRPADELWQMIGATPMIGQNDVREDVFTPDDAHRLIDFAREVELGRISFWSSNRDIACGDHIDEAHVSNTCSGVAQEPGEFGRIFTGGVPNPRSESEGEAGPDAAETTVIPGIVRDDPRTSPYPIWHTSRVYEEGDKIVWQGRVYVAKWWTRGDQPDAPVENAWDTPWQYLGPVLESDREAVRAERHAGDGEWPRWREDRAYVAGDEVRYEDRIFRALWWTQGDVPREDPQQSYDYPWEYLGKVEYPDEIIQKPGPQPHPAIVGDSPIVEKE